MSISGKSRKGSASKAIDRPFDAGILRKAKELAARYQVILQQEDGAFLGRGLELPMAMGDGKTADACVKNTREAFVTAVAYLLESGKPVPAPASEQQRSVQVNIRLTPTEKEQLESAARRSGFRGVSDYVRSAVLTAAGS